MFTINNVKWKICFADNNDKAFRKSDDTFAIGVTDRDTRTVFISKSLKGALLRKVLTHEMCHATIFSYGIYLDLMQEEYICDFVSLYGAEIVLNTEIVLKNQMPVRKFRNR